MKILKLLEMKTPREKIRDNPLELISQHKDDRDVYLYFHDIPKVGINPQAEPKFHTPLGVYSYPISHVHNKIKAMEIDRLKEFASDSTYVSIISQLGNTMNLSNPSPRDIKVLDRIYKDISKNPNFNLSEVDFPEYLRRKFGYDSVHFKWVSVIEASKNVNDSRAKLTKRFLEHKIHCIADFGEKLLSGDISNQAVHLTTSTIDVIKMMENK